MQVVLLNSPVTGLFVVAALYLQSANVASFGMLALASSNAAALLLGMHALTYADVC
jgi:urea transporter